MMYGYRKWKSSYTIVAYDAVNTQTENIQSSIDRDRESFLTSVRLNLEILEEWEKVK
jgi:hypothetical protein